MSVDERNVGGTASTPSTEGRGGTQPSKVSTPRKDGRDETRPSRKHPAHPPVVESFNRSIIVFVTVCAKDRHPVLATASMHDLLCRAWANADRWHVGHYVVSCLTIFTCSVRRVYGHQQASKHG